MKRLSILLTSILCSLSFIALTGTLTGCSDDSSGESPGLEPLQAAEPLRQDSGMTTRERLVVRDQATWTDTWRKLSSRQSTPLQTPQIDFSERAVIVASMGQMNSANHSISIDDVAFSGDSASFTVTESAPGAGCLSLPSISHPAAVVTVPTFTGEATFDEKRSELPCR